jgi:alkyl hydroperoxide reductase subunit AhpC
MGLRLGDVAPDFNASTTMGPIRFHQWLGSSWGILFSHPRDFTPICTTELGAVAKLKPEFDRRDVKVIGLSVDPIDDHQQWLKDIAETQGAFPAFPIIADVDRQISAAYDMIHPSEFNTQTVRTVFIIAPDKRIRLMITYPASTGRNFDEIIRVIDSLQLTADLSVGTPANWKQGEDVIIMPTVSDEEARQRFPKGFKIIKPYLRTTPAPRK